MPGAVAPSDKGDVSQSIDSQMIAEITGRYASTARVAGFHVGACLGVALGGAAGALAGGVNGWFCHMSPCFSRDSDGYVADNAENADEANTADNVSKDNANNKASESSSVVAVAKKEEEFFPGLKAASEATTSPAVYGANYGGMGTGVVLAVPFFLIGGLVGGIVGTGSYLLSSDGSVEPAKSAANTRNSA